MAIIHSAALILQMFILLLAWLMERKSHQEEDSEALPDEPSAPVDEQTALLE
ncbi:hypothetical protein DSO57_1004468 [Entomophthora muscae]|nr:hypothetical protein DSO57_1004468 [Entomophthora muscae]